MSGDIKRDIERLVSFSAFMEEYGISEYAFTLDGNENFEDANDFVQLWEGLLREPSLIEFMNRLIFVEQPIKRNSALSDETGDVFRHFGICSEGRMEIRVFADLEKNKSSEVWRQKGSYPDLGYEP